MSTAPEHRSTHESESDERNQSLKVYLNGRIVPREQALVSVYDAGFMLGDGIWEGIRLYNGKWAFVQDHMDRLYESARVVDMDIPLTREQMIEALDQTAAANQMTQDVHARLMITRGLKSKPFQDPRLSRQGLTIAIIMEHSKVPEHIYNKGITLHTVPIYRGLPVTQDPKLNSHSKLNCILACIHAQKAGADEALMLDPQGFVNTTNSCNFFIVRRGEVWTSTGDYCMNGITRQKVIDLCRAHQIPIHVRNFSLMETYGAEEAFLTGTFGAQTPVDSIDGRTIGTPGQWPMIEKIRKLYKNLVREDTA